MTEKWNLPVPAVFSYFEALSAIPHPSGHTRQISDYCADFAKKQGLFCRQDKAGNIVIRKPGSRGREEEPAVILQGHLDMVPAVAEGVEFDFTKDALCLHLEGDDLMAGGTTLGGDDGIAVAICLALLADPSLSHPPLICVFTVDEEIGMLGAMAMDMSDLNARYMLNLDSEAEGILTVGCAGGVGVSIRLPAVFSPVTDTDRKFIRITLSGLTGGHSGAEIHLNRGNAIHLLARILTRFLEKFPHALFCRIGGGHADNAIPARAFADLIIPPALLPDAEKFLRAEDDELRNAFRGQETPVLTLEETSPAEYAASSAEAVRVLTAVNSMPDGVQSMTPDMPELTESSLNLGVIASDEEGLRLSFSVRSSIQELKEGICQQLKVLTDSYGGTMTCSGDYPGWPLQKDTSLAALCCRIWEEMYGEEMRLMAVHGGLECGVFSAGIPGIEIVSYGPDMKDIHTAKERLSISSTAKIWDYTVEILRRLNQENL